MAEEIEKNGVKFYTHAAEGLGDEQTGQMLLELADMERQHEQTFAGMREGLSGREREQMVFDPDNEAALYLRAMADGHVFNVKKDPTVELAGKSIDEILKMAIVAEKDSIAFYLGLKDIVSERAGKDKVDAIIKEEMSHIAILSDKLKTLQ